MTTLTDVLLARVEELERTRHPVVWIPSDRSSYVEGQGYRAAIVLAGDDGYHLTGNWPYTGAPGEKMPWFWGPTLEAAEAAAVEQNRRAGVTPHEAALVVARSMARAGRTTR